MGILLRLSRLIDLLNERVARAAFWLILIVTLISAGNAVVRKLFNMSSNSLLEIQWYLFSGVFLLCAAFALQKNAHVRIDVIYGKFSKRTQMLIDIFGTVFFLFPMAFIILRLSWPVFMTSLTSGETSANAGGLPLWPARLLLPVGISLLILQGFSEIFKRVAFLTGKGPDPTEGIAGPSEEEELAEEIRKMRGLAEGEGK
ncbi:TRAP transporter small permease subunit [Niveibacterium umoris]|uniref:TRAP transporter small permease protein n=1 Tax=Niveibacterium umoris TaxID=1193620 RepID=A0A840BNQ1_9RHOO|nr:TRAP transporter small permease subunit [Niveibacterium umoris]MBB4014610.1 TRAP-type mannitol/chloroaromatic compound transport system permease small subunit [Niveibacterium umoris]